MKGWEKLQQTIDISGQFQGCVGFDFSLTKSQVGLEECFFSNYNKETLQGAFNNVACPWEAETCDGFEPKSTRW